MGVHVPQARYQRKSLAIDDFRLQVAIDRQIQALVFGHPDDSAIRYHDELTGLQFAIFDVHHRDVADQPVGRQLLGQGLRQFTMVFLLVLGLNFLQSRQEITLAFRRQPHQAIGKRE